MQTIETSVPQSLIAALPGLLASIRSDGKRHANIFAALLKSAKAYAKVDRLTGPEFVALKASLRNEANEAVKSHHDGARSLVSKTIRYREHKRGVGGDGQSELSEYHSTTTDHELTEEQQAIAASRMVNDVKVRLAKLGKRYDETLPTTTDERETIVSKALSLLAKAKRLKANHNPRLRMPSIDGALGEAVKAAQAKETQAKAQAKASEAKQAKEAKAQAKAKSQAAKQAEAEAEAKAKAEAEAEAKAKRKKADRHIARRIAAKKAAATRAAKKAAATVELKPGTYAERRDAEYLAKAEAKQTPAS